MTAVVPRKGELIVRGGVAILHFFPRQMNRPIEIYIRKKPIVPSLMGDCTLLNRRLYPLQSAIVPSLIDDCTLLSRRLYPLQLSFFRSFESVGLQIGDSFSHEPGHPTAGDHQRHGQTNDGKPGMVKSRVQPKLWRLIT